MAFKQSWIVPEPPTSDSSGAIRAMIPRHELRVVCLMLERINVSKVVSAVNERTCLARSRIAILALMLIGGVAVRAWGRRSGGRWGAKPESAEARRESSVMVMAASRALETVCAWRSGGRCG